jgi:hypothetical protein
MVIISSGLRWMVFDDLKSGPGEERYLDFGWQDQW